MKKNPSLLSFSLVLAGAAVLSTTANANLFKKKSAEPESVSGEIIVGLKDGFSLMSAKSSVKAAIAQSFGVNQILSMESLIMDEQIQKIRIRDEKKAKSIITELKKNPQVKYAEPNFIYRTMTAPNDSEFARQWDMVNTGQLDRPAGGTSPGQTGNRGSDINVQPLWDRGITGSRDILIAVIDTGVDYNHSDLKENIYTNAGEVAGNGVDDDGNGIVDDVHGASFVSGAGSNASLDDHNHGSHCAGTIAAEGNNRNGITGVNWQASILPVKFLSATGGGSLDGAVNSIKYATRMGAKIMSNSWGGGGYSEALKDAIIEAKNAGILFVAAAGNDSSDNDASPTYPANYPVDNIVSVAATDNRDVIASFSNYGRNTVHVAAPGKNILSTVKGGGYEIYSGTSMACPHVSGVAALVWSGNPNLTYAQIKQRLIETSTPVRGLRTKVLAKGRVNATNAYDNVIPPTSEPAENAWVSQDYGVESAHPYAANANQTFEVSVPGATHIRVVFEKFDTEARYDFVQVESPTGEVVDSVTGSRDGYVTEYVTGNKLILRLKSDFSEQRHGFKVSKIQVIR